MPDDPNNEMPQRTKPAVQPETDAEVSDNAAELAGPEYNSPSANEREEIGDVDSVDASAELSEILENPSTVTAVIEFLKEMGLDYSDVKVSAGMWEYPEGRDIAHVETNGGSREYFVSPDPETTTRMAVALMKNDLKEDPNMFNESFIQSYINTDRLRRNLRPDMEEMARNAYDGDPENMEDEIEIQVDRELKDPLEYLRGIYGEKNVVKEAIRIGGINADEAAEDAVAADGEGARLGSYDGNVNSLPSGGDWWRQN